MLEFSTTTTASYDKSTVYAYIVEGLLVILVNMFLAVRLFSNRHLRAQKEYVVIGSCIVFDIIFGLTYFSAGLARLIISMEYEYFPLVTMFDCFSTFHIQLFIIITIVAGLQLLATALDRFFCIFLPITYIKRQIEYSYFIMIIPYLLIIPFWIPGALESYENRSVKQFSMICRLNQSLPVFWYTCYRTLRITSTLLCILIYIPIFIKIFKSIHSHKKLVPGASSKNNGRLLSMTRTVALITGSTLTFFTIPDVIISIYPIYDSNFFYLMNLQKGLVNILIFMLTQKTLRSLMFPVKNGNVTLDNYSSRKITPTMLVHVI